MKTLKIYNEIVNKGVVKEYLFNGEYVKAGDDFAVLQTTDGDYTIKSPFTGFIKKSKKPNKKIRRRTVLAYIIPVSDEKKYLESTAKKQTKRTSNDALFNNWKSWDHDAELNNSEEKATDDKSIKNNKSSHDIKSDPNYKPFNLTHAKEVIKEIRNEANLNRNNLLVEYNRKLIKDNQQKILDSEQIKPTNSKVNDTFSNLSVKYRKRSEELHKNKIVPSDKITEAVSDSSKSLDKFGRPNIFRNVISNRMNKVIEENTSDNSVTNDSTTQSNPYLIQEINLLNSNKNQTASLVDNPYSFTNNPYSMNNSNNVKSKTDFNNFSPYQKRYQPLNNYKTYSQKLKEESLLKKAEIDKLKTSTNPYDKIKLRKYILEFGKDINSNDQTNQQANDELDNNSNSSFSNNHFDKFSSTVNNDHHVHFQYTQFKNTTLPEKNNTNIKTQNPTIMPDYAKPTPPNLPNDFAPDLHSSNYREFLKQQSNYYELSNELKNLNLKIDLQNQQINHNDLVSKLHNLELKLAAKPEATSVPKDIPNPIFTQPSAPIDNSVSVELIKTIQLLLNNLIPKVNLENNLSNKAPENVNINNDKVIINESKEFKSEIPNIKNQVKFEPIQEDVNNTFEPIQEDLNNTFEPIIDDSLKQHEVIKNKNDLHKQHINYWDQKIHKSIDQYNSNQNVKNQKQYLDNDDEYDSNNDVKDNDDKKYFEFNLPKDPYSSDTYHDEFLKEQEKLQEALIKTLNQNTTKTPDTKLSSNVDNENQFIISSSEENLNNYEEVKNIQNKITEFSNNVKIINDDFKIKNNIENKLNSNNEYAEYDASKLFQDINNKINQPYPNINNSNNSEEIKLKNSIEKTLSTNDKAVDYNSNNLLKDIKNKISEPSSNIGESNENLEDKNSIENKLNSDNEYDKYDTVKLFQDIKNTINQPYPNTNVENNKEEINLKNSIEKTLSTNDKVVDYNSNTLLKDIKTQISEPSSNIDELNESLQIKNSIENRLNGNDEYTEYDSTKLFQDIKNDLQSLKNNNNLEQIQNDIAFNDIVNNSEQNSNNSNDLNYNKLFENMKDEVFTISNINQDKNITNKNLKNIIENSLNNSKTFHYEGDNELLRKIKMDLDASNKISVHNHHNENDHLSAIEDPADEKFKKDLSIDSSLHSDVNSLLQDIHSDLKSSVVLDSYNKSNNIKRKLEEALNNPTNFNYNSISDLNNDKLNLKDDNEKFIDFFSKSKNMNERKINDELSSDNIINNNTSLPSSAKQGVENILNTNYYSTSLDIDENNLNNIMDELLLSNPKINENQWNPYREIFKQQQLNDNNKVNQLNDTVQTIENQVITNDVEIIDNQYLANNPINNNYQYIPSQNVDVELNDNYRNNQFYVESKPLVNNSVSYENNQNSNPLVYQTKQVPNYVYNTENLNNLNHDELLYLATNEFDQAAKKFNNEVFVEKYFVNHSFQIDNSLDVFNNINYNSVKTSAVKATIDITKLLKMQNQITKNNNFEGIEFSIISLLVKAISKALLEAPEMNLIFDAKTKTVLQKITHNIGLATETAEGIIIPVVRFVEKLDMVQTASNIQSVLYRLKDGELFDYDLYGYTTILSSYDIATSNVKYDILAKIGTLIGVKNITKQIVEKHSKTYVKYYLDYVVVYNSKVNTRGSANKFSHAFKQILLNPEAILE